MTRIIMSFPWLTMISFAQLVLQVVALIMI